MSGVSKDDDDMWASRRRHPTARPVAGSRRSHVYAGLMAVVVTLNRRRVAEED